MDLCEINDERESKECWDEQIEEQRASARMESAHARSIENQAHWATLPVE